MNNYKKAGQPKSSAQLTDVPAELAAEKLIQRVPLAGELEPQYTAEDIARATQSMSKAGGVKDPELAARIISSVWQIQDPFGKSADAAQAACEMSVLKACQKHCWPRKCLASIM